MAKFRPETTQGKSFLGFQEVGIIDFVDHTSKYDWADVCIDVNLQGNGSFPVVMRLSGSYEKEPNGNIKDCSLLRKQYYLFDAIGFTGGPTLDGSYEDGDDKQIGDTDKLVEHLNNVYAHQGNPLTSEPKKVYYAFVYKEWSEQDQKAWTRVCPKLVMNDSDGRVDLESYVQFMKSKGFIKEYDASKATQTKSVSPKQSSFGNTSTPF